MRRRDLLTMVGGAAVLWPLAVIAQRPARPRRLAVVMAAGRTPEYVAAFAAFETGLRSLGWQRGRNLQIDDRWSAGNAPAHVRSIASDIVAQHPDVIFAQSAPVVGALLATTRSIPIVFVHVADPVASGFVPSLARPGGNVTGITNIEPTMGGKWLQLLKEIAPSVSRAALLYNPDAQPRRGAIFLDPFEAAARSLAVASVPAVVHDMSQVAAAMTRLGAAPNGGVVVTPDAYFASHSTEIVAHAARLRLPAVYPYRYYVAQGGLLSYGVNNRDLFRQAAPYVDRILRGEKPADLPVMQPARFELIVNQRTAMSLGVPIAPSILTRADEILD